VARAVLRSAGSVSVIGPPERYGHLGYPMVADAFPDFGPLGGIYTALINTRAVWNLIVACDMPALEAESLTKLLEEAALAPETDVVMAESEGRLQPLCAVYHRHSAEPFRKALLGGEHKILNATNRLMVRYVSLPSRVFTNVNTPDEWEAAVHG